MICLAALGWSAPPSDDAPLHARFVVVVNADNPIASLDRDKVSKILLKRVTTWPTGKATEPVDLPATNSARAAFSEAVHKKTARAIIAFWQQQIFSGRDVPPPEKKNDDAVLSYVRDHAGGIGYVSSATVLPAGVRTLTITSEGQ
jgi:ABC-type phosphate transport system substrate-binding protein